MRKNNGITMIALVITVIILLILAGISINSGSSIIEKSKLENTKTNMLLLKVKGKEYAEKANFDLGTKIDEISAEDKASRIEKAKSELKGEDITATASSYSGISNSDIVESDYVFFYKLSNQDLADMGLSSIKSDESNGFYIIRYNIMDIEIEVYNTKGYENKGTSYYSLNDIQNLSL